MNKTSNQLKHRATQLLRKYDKARQDLRKLEAELHEACVEYGSTQGYGLRYNRDHLRTQLLIEEEQRAKREKAA